jgi:16S rRNA (cytosine967-C5)-methyltransferase
LLAPGGLLVYATCSVLAAENEEVVAAIREAHEDLATVQLAERFDVARAEALGHGGSLAVAPDRHGTDGFFAQVFRRT